ncbi:MAG: response regulator [Bacteroidetes bacterium]|nr:response regulator [Bacteroidota bacterium]HET6244315.1 response regulator [Bacteroidia bacterium]
MKNKQKINIFFVDDDLIYLKMLENNLKHSRHYSSNIHTFTSGEECLKNMNIKPDVVVLDYFLNGTNPKAINGIQTMQEIKKLSPETKVVILSGQDKIDIAVTSVKEGAFDYVSKSESAFVRTQNAINNIVHAKKLKDEAKDQRLWLRLTASVFLITVLVFLTLSFIYNP